MIMINIIIMIYEYNVDDYDYYNGINNTKSNNNNSTSIKQPPKE